MTDIIYGGGMAGASAYDVYAEFERANGRVPLSVADWLEQKVKGDPAWYFDPNNPDWDADTVWAERAVVRHSGSLWYALRVNAGAAPGTDDSAWVKLVEGIDQAIYDDLLSAAQQQATLAGGSASSAAGFAAAAQADRVLAQSAAQGALLGANIYANKAAGEAATANGQQFVAFGPTGFYATRYLMVASAGVAQDTYYNKAGLDTALAGKADNAQIEVVGQSLAALDANAVEVLPASAFNSDTMLDYDVDQTNRPSRAWDREGRRFAADDSETDLVHVFGGPEEVSRPYDLIGRRTFARLDKTLRPIEEVRIDGSRWIAVGGNLVPYELRSIVLLGDSTTNNDQMDDDPALLPNWQQYRWGNRLGERLGVPIINRGMNGHKTEQIAFRAGAIMGSAVVTGGVIPASGSVTLTGLVPGDPMVLASGQATYILVVDLITDDGTAVRGTLNRASATNYTFTRIVTGAAKTSARVDMISVTGREDAKSSFVIFGSGTNDEPAAAGPALTAAAMTELKSRFMAMATRAPNGYLCWGPLDRGLSEAAGTYRGDFIREFEAWAAATFGANFVNVRAFLASPRALEMAPILNPAWVKAVSADPNQDDDACIAAGTVAWSLRYGGVHTNLTGSLLQAWIIERELRARFNFPIAA